MASDLCHARDDGRKQPLGYKVVRYTVVHTVFEHALDSHITLSASKFSGFLITPLLLYLFFACAYCAGGVEYGFIYLFYFLPSLCTETADQEFCNAASVSSLFQFRLRSRDRYS